MPNVEVSLRDMQNLIGKKLSAEQLREAAIFAKCEVDSIEGDKIIIDVKDTNRPDLWSAEGIAREIKARIGLEKGLPKFSVKKSNLVVKIEKSVKGVRPFTVCSIVKNVKVTEDLLIQMIQLQEKIAGTFGRKRKEAAIGIYDFDKIHGNIRYYGADPRKTKFIPLEFKNELDLDEILELHPKGIEFGQLLKGQKLYPIFEDSEGHILSMPPIINSNYSGKVTEQTKNLFIEVSGFDEERIGVALSIMTLAIAERGGQICSVKVVDANGKSKFTPNLEPKKISVDFDEINRLSGLGLDKKKALELLQRARFSAKAVGKKILVAYPVYRHDIIHQVDVIEDAIISFGYNKIEPAEVKIATIGRELPDARIAKVVRETCVGLGLQEILTFTMTSKQKQAQKIGLDSGKESFVEITNPVSENYCVFRKRVFPELLEFLGRNKHCQFPQKIFEFGKTVLLDSKAETGVSEKNTLSIVLCGKGAEFNTIKSVLDAVTRNLGLEYSLKESELLFLEKGKQAEISIGPKKGFLGELSKNAMRGFGLEQETVVLEMEI